MTTLPTRINKMYGPHPGDTVLYQLADAWNARFRNAVSFVLYPEYWWEYKEVRAVANVVEFLQCTAEGRAFLPVSEDPNPLNDEGYCQGCAYLGPRRNMCENPRCKGYHVAITICKSCVYGPNQSQRCLDHESCPDLV